MNHAFIVRGSHRFSHRGGQFDDAARRESAGRQELTQRLAINELHCEEMYSVALLKRVASR